MKLIVALLVFGIIVIFHEFGHFIVAKKNGIVVEEFAVGMGPKLFGVRRGETEYTLRLLPLGGACMMLGEDTAEEVIPGSFNSKSVWARMAVVAAGPVFNFIMAFVCAVIIIGMNGYISGEILQVEDGSPAMEAGLEAGDIITKADRTSVHTFSDFRMHIALNQGRKCTITYIRDGEKHQTTVTPEMTDDGVYRIGIVGGVQEKPKFGGLLISSFYEVKSNIDLVIKSLEMMIQGQVSRSDVAGPVGMFQVIGDSYESAAKYGHSKCDTNHCSYDSFAVSQSWRDESAADSCTGWRTSCLSYCGSPQRQAGTERQRGVCAYDRLCDSYGNHGACHVQ